MLPSALKLLDPSPDKKSSDPLEEFLAETRLHTRRKMTDTAQNRVRFFTAAAIGLGLFVGVAVAAALPYLPDVAWPANPDGPPAPMVVSESTVTLTSTPLGADVLINGVHSGKTPLSLTLPVGLHVAVLQNDTASRRTTLRVEAGKIVGQHVDFGAAPATGELEISSDPAGAHVSVDGVASGRTPLTIAEMTPGEHRVTISSGQTSVERTVDIKAGATATVLVSVPVSASSGWVAVDAPVEIQVFEGGKLLGTGSAWRIALPPGRHTLEVVNRSLAFRAETTVDVVAGRAVPLNVPLPSGTLSVNALPWAEVWVDGRPVGQTPIGNLSVSLGSHEVVWRHPDHGERRQLVLVSAAEPVRLGVDWTR